MRDTPYWHPRHETMPREEVEALQVRKLRSLLRWANERVPFHADRFAEAGVSPDEV
jgi:phenylacetate-CoA ligase